jgi:hypothetical protein
VICVRAVRWVLACGMESGFLFLIWGYMGSGYGMMGWRDGRDQDGIAWGAGLWVKW